MIYLDTHVVVWLYEGLLEKFSKKAVELMESESIIISPAVKLELSYLHEINRITCESQIIISDLQLRLGLKICNASFEKIINHASELTWTRDPFDRLIVANAVCEQAKLLTKDNKIREHVKFAVWD